MAEVSLEAIQQAVENLHNCRAKHRQDIWVIEQYEGQTVWEGNVSIFDIEGHPTATTCYAWSSPVEGSTKHRFYAVLKLPPVESPEDAVRAAIVRDSKGNNL